MFTQQYLENVMDGLTSLEECKRKSTVMKLHLDAKVENVDMLFGTTIDTAYLVMMIVGSSTTTSSS